LTWYRWRSSGSALCFDGYRGEWLTLRFSADWLASVLLGQIGQHEAFVGGHHAACAALEDRFAERLLERLDLHAHGRLRTMDQGGAAHETARIGDGDDHRQHVQIKGFHASIRHQEN
jgi:hypothetical protein